MTERLHCDMSLEQGEAVRQGLDLATRMGLGQIGEIAQLARMGHIRVRDDAATDGHREATVEECDRIESLTGEIARILGHPRGGSFGIGNRGVPMNAKRQYETGKAIAKALADRRDPGGHSVHHDGIGVRYAPDAVTIATIVGEPR